MLTVYCTVAFFNLINILADDTESSGNKLRLAATVPFAYPLLLVMTLVDFVALIKSMAKLPDLIRRKNQGAHWQHVERVGKSVSL